MIVLDTAALLTQPCSLRNRFFITITSPWDLDQTGNKTC